MIGLLPFLLSLPAFAQTSFDGLFIHVARGEVEYFSLTQTDNQVAGFFYGLVADPRVRGGVAEKRINVSGLSDGYHVNFREGQGDFSSTLGWIAKTSNSGFSLTFPSNGGYLNDEEFSRASTDQLNAAILNLRQNVARDQNIQASNDLQARAQRELTFAETRLERDLSDRPRLLEALIKAKAALREAQSKLDAANTQIAARQADADKAKAISDSADAAAQTFDDRQRANDLRLAANDKRLQVSTAKTDAFTVSLDVNSAQNDLDSAHRDLASTDAEISKLRQAISVVKKYLAGR